ncbi:MAG: NUDIX hydrolase [Candidatus Moranbacteria bacterium]|nr:NUDIX hydrolase [Candidatus Moranbacteria bacterium]NTW75993.1 NUDIX hydrolase [Candidatus Moranbacteria bacterium]
MAHLKCNIGEYGVIMNGEGKFLILHLPLNEEFKTEVWMLPGGRLEFDDRPEEGLLREVREETGLDIEIVTPVHTARWGIEDPPKYSVYYLCRAIGEADVRMSGEHTEARWIGFDSLDEVSWLNDTFKSAVERAACHIRLLK